MPNDAVNEQLNISELIRSVDATRVAGDRFKLLAVDLADLESREASLRATDAVTLTAEGGRVTAQGFMRTALDLLNARLHDGFNHLKAIPGYDITEAERLGLLTSYGWLQGEIGVLTDARIESLANQALTVTPTITNPAWRYSAALITHITTQLAIVNANQPIATGGSVNSAFDARDLAYEKLKLMTSRIRHFYCSASDEVDRTEELTRIGMDARGPRGQRLPGQPLEPTFDPIALTLTIPVLPEGATSINAMRQAAGGEPELAGTGAPGSLTVSVVQFSPLIPGVTYEFWLVGHNSQGDGPESNHVLHAVPVGP